MIAGTWFSSYIIQMIDKHIVCWEVKKNLVHKFDLANKVQRVNFFETFGQDDIMIFLNENKNTFKSYSKNSVFPFLV